jgi:tRNA A22 N-methylase
MYRKPRRDGIQGVSEIYWLRLWLQLNTLKIIREPMINCVGYYAVIFCAFFQSERTSWPSN